MRPAFKKIFRPAGISLVLIILLIALTAHVPERTPAPLNSLLCGIVPKAEQAIRTGDCKTI